MINLEKFSTVAALVIVLILSGLGIYAYPKAGIPLLMCFLATSEMRRRCSRNRRDAEVGSRAHHP